MPEWLQWVRPPSWPLSLLKLFNLCPQGITNYAKLVREMSKVLRPGGLLHLQEWDFFVGANLEAA
jgi:hypothetical protein